MLKIDEQTRRVESKIEDLNIDEITYMVFFDLVKLVNPSAYYHNLKEGESPKSMIGNNSIVKFENQTGGSKINGHSQVRSKKSEPVEDQVSQGLKESIVDTTS